MPGQQTQKPAGRAFSFINFLQLNELQKVNKTYLFFFVKEVSYVS
jgi:hypothetical protein